MNLQELIARQKLREAEESPSLANTKNAQVHQKLTEKKNKIQSDPNSPLASLRRLHGSSGNTDLMDLGEASLYRSGGIVMDGLRGLSNWAFGTELDDSVESGWSNQRTADIKAGVTQEYRRQLQEDQHKVIQQAAEGDYWGSIKSAADVSTRTLFDSAGVVPELAAGGLLTLAGGLGGAAVLGRRGQKVIEGADKLFDTFQDARNLRKTTMAFRKPARKFGESSALKNNVKEVKKWFDPANLAKKGGKATAQTSIVNLEMTQQARAQVEEEYGPEGVTPGRIGATFAINALTLSVNPAIIKNFYLPKIPGAKQFAETKGLTKASLTAADEIRKQFQNEVKRIVKTTDKSLIKNVASAVLDGATKVSKAGGAEMMQEYAQTWGEALSVHVGQDGTPFWQSLVDELTDSGNISEATGAAFMGGFAGAQMRGATAGPVTAARVFTETAAKTGRKVTSVAAHKVAVKDFASISPERQAELAEESLMNRAALEEAKTENAARVDELEKAQSLDDITDEKIIEDMFEQNKKGKYDLNDPASFAAFKEGMQAYYKSQTDYLETKDVITAHGKVALEKAKAGGQDIIQKAADVAKKVLPDDWQQQLIDLEVKARNVTDDTVDFIQNIDTPRVKAFAEIALDDTILKTKEGVKKLRQKAAEVAPEKLREIADFVGKRNPDIAEEINKQADKIEAAETRASLRAKRVVTYDKLSLPTKQMAEQGLKTEKGMKGHASRLMNEVKQRPGDIETVRALQKAFTAYEQSEAFKTRQGEDGILTPANLKNARKKLANFEADLETPVTDAVVEAAGDAVDFVTDIVKATPKAVKKGAKFVEEAVTEIIVGPKKKRYKVTLNKSGHAFVQGLEKNAARVEKLKAEDNMDAVDQGLTEVMDHLTSDNTIASYPTMFDTRDAAVVVDIISHYLPDIPSKKLLAALNEKWDAPASEIPKEVTKKKAKVQDKDTIPLTPDGTIRLDEAGTLTVDAKLTPKEKADIFALKSGITICQ
jgi:hypothetical protein